MIKMRHPEANERLRRELDAFESYCGPRGYALHVQYEPTPAIFALSQQELDEHDPFAWPHHYEVLVVHDFGYWKNKVVHSTINDLPGAIRALIEGVELGVSDDALNDWMLARLA